MWVSCTQIAPGVPPWRLDLMEELRPVFADRLALSLVNRKQISGKGFTQKESGGILMDDETRKEVLVAWQERKQDEIMHPYLKERIPFGLIPACPGHACWPVTCAAIWMRTRPFSGIRQ